MSNTLTRMERTPHKDAWRCPRCGLELGSNDLLAALIQSSECNCEGLGIPPLTPAKEATNVHDP